MRLVLLSLRGVKRRSNLVVTSSIFLRDCFAEFILSEVEGLVMTQTRKFCNVLRRSFSFLAVFAIASFPALAQGAGLVPCGGPSEPACQFCHIFILIWNIVNFLMWQIAPPLAVLLFVVAGVMLLMSGANPGLRNKGKGMILGAIIGFATVLLAWLIINTVIIALTGSASFGGYAPRDWFDPPACL